MKTSKRSTIIIDLFGLIGSTLSIVVIYWKIKVHYLRKYFDFDHCWPILKDNVKWQDVPNTSRKSMAQSMATDSSPQSPNCSQIRSTSVSLDDDQNGGSVSSPNKKRPSGRKTEKELRKKNKQNENSRFCNLVEQFNQQASATETRKAELESRKVKALEELKEIQKQQVEAKEREMEDQIMMMDTSNMDPQKQAYYEFRKHEIMQKMMARASNYVPQPPSP